jgi:ubiquinone/menaquinone biosynthesis C-methylase UbiE
MTSLLPLPRTEPFDAIAREYDAHFTNSLIGRAQRESVWLEMDRLFRPGQRVLDINCGTGVDAMHLSARGIHVVACDASQEMISVARQRLDTSTLRNHVDFRVLAIEQIAQLEKEGLYDGVLSNFAGLNCVADLRGVALDLARLVRPGGKMILCLFGRFCLWEMLWYLIQGKFKKAFRRLASGPVTANLAPGYSVWVRYPTVGSLRQVFAPHFRLVGWRGIGIAVPPTYWEPWAQRFARLIMGAAMIDPFLGQLPGFRSLADHVVLVLERVQV